MAVYAKRQKNCAKNVIIHKNHRGQVWNERIPAPNGLMIYSN